MKILFDLTVFQTGDKKRGIGRYAKNFLNEFLKTNKDYDIHFLTTRSAFNFCISTCHFSLYFAMNTSILADFSV